MGPQILLNGPSPAQFDPRLPFFRLQLLPTRDPRGRANQLKKKSKMNNATSATSSPPPQLPVEDVGSDTDTISEAEEPSHYQPISADDDGSNSDEEHHHLAARLSRLPNGHRSCHGSSEDDDDDEEGAETAIWRAFREDEERRSAAMTRENAERVVEAMRRISFVGSPPDWAGQVPEHQWMDRLRRQAATSTSPGPNPNSAGAVPN